ncbi:unnamed protein product [Brachionus calyciflorus]|uniref:Uncharacterized protein n=1 Tax=Brachionus calyciflorus TaxID=104777 RepID=A0A813MGS7_9BILA|nr:unnamed protein product [Brachionus calyciflorus]
MDFSDEKCEVCQIHSEFLITIPCDFEICTIHFPDLETEIQCPVCEKHYFSFDQCLKTAKNKLRITTLELEQKYLDFHERVNEYKLIKKDAKNYIYQRQSSVFAQIDLAKIQLKNNICQQIDENYLKLKNSYSQQLDDCIKELKIGLNSIRLDNLDSLEMLKFKSQQISIQNRQRFIDLRTKQLEQFNSKLSEIDSIFTKCDHIEFIPAHINLNFPNQIGLLKTKQNEKFNKDLNELKVSRTFNGHCDVVNCLVLNNIGNFLISSSYDGTIKLWNRESGHCLRTFTEHTKRVKCIRLYENKYIISSSNDKTIKIWDYIDNKCVQTLKGPDVITHCLEILENGKIICGDSDAKIRIWQIDSGNIVNVYNNAHESSIYNILLMSENLFLTCSADKKIKLWSFDSLKELKTFSKHEKYVWFMTKINSCEFLSASADGTIIHWNINEEENYVKIFNGRKDVLFRSIVYLENGDFLTSSDDGLVEKWNLTSNKSQEQIQCHQDSTYFMLITNDGNILTSSKDTTIKLWI